MECLKLIEETLPQEEYTKSQILELYQLSEEDFNKAITEKICKETKLKEEEFTFCYSKKDFISQAFRGETICVEVHSKQNKMIHSYNEKELDFQDRYVLNKLGINFTSEEKLVHSSDEVVLFWGN